MGDKAWIYYLCGALVLLLAIGAASFFFVHRKHATDIFKRQAYRKLYRLAQDQDYYLLNNLTIKTETDSLHIDHLLVGDKFVYVIATRYYEDDLQGESYLAKKWHVVDKNGTTLREASNPVVYNEKRTMCLAKFLGWNTQKTPMFISLVIIDNATEVNVADKKISEYSYLIHKKDACSLIKQIERDTPLPPFDDQSLLKIITRIHRLSEEDAKVEAYESSHGSEMPSKGK